MWERAELEEHIGGYLKKYGDPIIYMYAYNYETGQEYLEVYWNVKGRKLKVVLYKEDFVWDVMEDQIARSRL